MDKQKLDATQVKESGKLMEIIEKIELSEKHHR